MIDRTTWLALGLGCVGVLVFIHIRDTELQNKLAADFRIDVRDFIYRTDVRLKAKEDAVTPGAEANSGSYAFTLRLPSDIDPTVRADPSLGGPEEIVRSDSDESTVSSLRED